MTCPNCVRLNIANDAKDAALERLGEMADRILRCRIGADSARRAIARQMKRVARAALSPDAGKGWVSHLTELDGAADGLRTLADWFDVDDEQKGHPADKDEMQRDLRRWAAALDTLKRVE